MTNQTPPMEQNQNKNQDQNQNSMQNDLRDSIVKGLTKNWGTKLLALVIAIVLWAGLISQDPSLTREKTFNGVSISITGEDTMKRNGFIVVNDLESKLDNAFLRVEVPQLQYNTVTSSPFNARVDLSRIKTTGRQTINISTTNTSIYGSVKEIEPASVEVVVEEYITRYRIPVMISIVGKVPDGYYAATPSVDPPMIAVSGPRSLVEQVARAEAVLDLSVLPAQEGSVRTALPIVLQAGHENDCAICLCNLSRQLAQNASAGYQHIVSGPDHAALAYAAAHTGQRLAQSCCTQRYTIRNVECVLCRNHHVFGKTAVTAAAYAFPLRAQHPQTLTAPLTLLTRIHSGEGDDAVTGLIISDVCTHLADHAGKLMSGDDWRIAGIGIVHQVEICTTNTTGIHLHFDIVCSGHRFRNLHIPHTVRPVLYFYQRIHTMYSSLNKK